MSTSTRGTGFRFRVGTLLIYLSSLALVGSAVAKLAHIPKVASELAALGFDDHKLALIAFLEIASALLLAYANTRSFGLLMVSAYLGGAIATHVGHDQLPFRPAVVLVLVWLGIWLRHPEILWSTQRISS